jgi:hypothetical protein
MRIMDLLRPVTAAVVVAGGVVVAGIAAGLPAIGAVPPSGSAVPAPATQQLVCPGGVVAVGAAGSSASALTAVDGAALTKGTVAGGRLAETRLHRGNVTGSLDAAPRLLRAPAARSAGGAAAGAQSQQIGSGDALGLAATACIAPTDTLWLSGGATTTGRTTVLLLANPSDVSVTATPDIWTDRGAVDPGAGGGAIVVPAHSRRAVSLASLAPNASGLTVRVRTSGGRIAAALEQRTVLGLESGGVDLIAPTAEPAAAITIAGVRVADSAVVQAAAQSEGYGDLAPVLRVLVPGRTAANVSVTASGSSTATLHRHVPAGAVVDLPLPSLQDGAVGLHIVSTEPVVAAARVSVISSSAPADLAPTATEGGGTPTVDRGADLAWFAASPPLGAEAAAAVPAGPSPQLSLTNAGDATVKATVSGAGGTVGVSVGAGRTVTLPVTEGVVRVRNARGLVGSISLAGTGAIAGYPVAQAGQSAHRVHVTY